jgi:hypothetical protein
MHFINSFPWKKHHPHLRTHSCWSLLVNFNYDAETSVSQRSFASFSLGKMSPSPSNAGLPELSVDFSDSVHRL